MDANVEVVEAGQGGRGGTEGFPTSVAPTLGAAKVTERTLKAMRDSMTSTEKEPRSTKSPAQGRVQLVVTTTHYRPPFTTATMPKQ